MIPGQQQQQMIPGQQHPRPVYYMHPPPYPQVIIFANSRFPLFVLFLFFFYIVEELKLLDAEISSLYVCVLQDMPYHNKGRE